MILESHRRTLLTATLALATFLASASTTGALILNKCQAGKRRCVSKATACLLAVHAKAATRGVLDASQLLKCKQKLDGNQLAPPDPTKGCIQKLQLQGNCQTLDETAAMQTKIDTFVDDVVCALDYSTCPPPPPRFVDNGDGTVIDNETGLQWEKKTTTVGSGANLADPHDVDNQYTWTSSGSPYPPNGSVFTDFLVKLNNCTDDGTYPPTGTSGGFAGHCDWRVPTIIELQTILLGPYFCNATPCINAAFGPTAADFGYYYWSSTTRFTDPSAAWEVSFDDGFVGWDYKNITRNVRAVRGGD